MSNEAPRLVVAIDIGTVQSAVNIFYRSTRRTLYLISVGDRWRFDTSLYSVRCRGYAASSGSMAWPGEIAMEPVRAVSTAVRR